MFISVLLFTLFLNSCFALKKQKISTSPIAGQKFGLDVLMDDDVLEVTSHRPDNAPDNFRETVSRYVFKRQIVAHKDESSNKCYVQRTELSREDIERRLNNIRDNTSLELDGVTEEWVIPSKAVPISSLWVQSMFGPEVAEFCRYQDVLFLGDGSYGVHEATNTGIRTSGHLSSLGRHKRERPPDIIIVTDEYIILVWVCKCK